MTEDILVLHLLLRDYQLESPGKCMNCYFYPTIKPSGKGNHKQGGGGGGGGMNSYIKVMGVIIGNFER